MDLNTKVKAAEEVIYADMDEETVLMNVADGQYYSLNAVGSSVWRQVGEPVPVLAVCNAIEQEYKVEPLRCRRDVLALLNQLQGIGLVEIIDEPV
jgi:hypothetical protein